MANNKEKINLVGARLISAFHHMLGAVRIHQDNNLLIKECATELFALFSEVSDNDSVSIGIWHGRVYLQGEKLKYHRDIFTLLNEMTAFFAAREIGELSFSQGIGRISHEDLAGFMRLLNEARRHEHPRQWLEKRIRESGYGWVDVFEPRESVEQPLDNIEKAKNLYFSSLSTVKEVAEKASKGIAGVRKARRVAQMVVDLIQEDSSLLLGLATIRDYDDYTYTHSVNVAMLATCLGRYIGLPRVYLEHLMVCGLFHDLGKVGVSKDILLKKGELSTQEWDIMRKHPLIGVRKILRLNAPHALRVRIILGPFEHHLNLDLSGYPKTRHMKKLSVMGRILRIADVYEALTSERVYRPRSFTPDEALRRMWSERGKNFDPLLLKLFINMLGIYPVGSMVGLDTSEIGVVMEYTDETQKDKPHLLLLVADGKGGFNRGGMINLADPMLTPRRSITRALHPAQLGGIQPSQFFLQDPATPAPEDPFLDTMKGFEDGF